jgi:hypothetical protein
MARTSSDRPSGEQFVEAARMLRTVLDEAPPTTARDRATARRIEGAALALDAVGAATAGCSPRCDPDTWGET